MRTALVALLVAVSPPVSAAEPTAIELMRRYDEVMSPRTFDSLIAMTTHRQDGSTRGYTFRALKSADDKIRIWFLEPASAKGQEMLRVGDNMWVYMPNLKRSLRVAARDSFEGGDFNNGDFLRVNYVADYTGKLVPSTDARLWALELLAKTPEASYDRIKLWLTKDTLLPARAEYYAASGKLLRSSVFDEVKRLRGHERPTHVVMRNELAKQRYSEITIRDMKLDIEVAAQKFVLDELGR